MRNILKVLCLTLFFSMVFWGAKPAFTTELPHVGNVEYFFTRDTSSELEDVLALGSEVFKPLQSNYVRMEDADKLLWLRIPASVFENHWDRYSDSIFLALKNEYILHTNLYYPASGEGYKRLVYDVDFDVDKDQHFPATYPTFQLRRIPSDSFIYLSVTTNVPITFDVVFFDNNAFYNYFISDQTHSIVFYTFLVAMIIYYFFFYIMTAYPSYLILALRQVGIFLLAFVMSGYVRFYFTAAAQLTAILMLAGVLLFSVASVSFAGSFLQRGSRFYKALWVARILFFLLTAAAIYFLRSPYLIFLFSASVLLIDTAIGGLAGIFGFHLNRWKTSFFIASRLFLAIGMILFFLEKIILLSGFYIGLSRAFIVLEPIILAFILLPETRRRLQDYSALEKTSERYKDLSQHDSMTGLYNKASLLSFLEKNLQIRCNTSDPMAFFMFDIDHFKKFNDTWGHLEGDKAINLTANIIKQSIREKDLPARYGGEEFSAVILDCSKETAIHIAERIRKTCEERSYSLGDGRNFTVSAGGAFLRPDDDSNSLIKRADSALYCAKMGGRNRVKAEL